jgi:hypothetical protein
MTVTAVPPGRAAADQVVAESWQAGSVTGGSAPSLRPAADLVCAESGRISDRQRASDSPVTPGLPGPYESDSPSQRLP